MTSTILMARVIARAQKAGVFDESVANQLTEIIGTKTVGEIGQTKFELSEQLGDDVPEVDQVASDLLDYMRGAELIGLPNAAPAAPAMPTEFVFRQAVTRETMGLRPLLAELVEHPDDAKEIIRLIRATDTVKRAEQKLLGRREWAIANKGGGLNVAESLSYANHLADDDTQAQRQWHGAWPTTLERAIGQERRVMIYPFPATKSELRLVGPDKFGRDWSVLTDVQHEAMVWAVATRHRNLPAPDRRLTDDLFAPELPVYLREIVEDYEQAKGRGDSSTRGISRYAPDDMVGVSSGSRLPFGGSNAQDPAWCKQQLEAVAKRSVSTISNAVSKDAVVVRSIETVSGQVVLRDTIVLGSIKTISGAIGGRGYILTGKSISSVSGHVDDDNIIDLGYVGLYEKAVELGIIAA